MFYLSVAWWNVCAMSSFQSILLSLKETGKSVPTQRYSQLILKLQGLGVWPLGRLRIIERRWAKVREKGNEELYA